ncbi:MAG: MFS transporter [Gemmatimonadetes bacterium]|nr:MFS transporter [Gemmatimonadota bacterium]
MTATQSRQPRLQDGLILATLVAAGEAAFLLPFVLARVFRPTFLAVFEISNFELGTAFSLYGIVAMVSYFAGGPLADRFSARKLMTLALTATGAGGLFLVGIPSARGMNMLWATWGMTTIFLFWAAMIRSTREWGQLYGQGKAYGLLDGGRGLLAAAIASFSVLIFSLLLPDRTTTEITPDQRAMAFRSVIWIFTGLTLAIAFLVWKIIPDTDLSATNGKQKTLSVHGIKSACRMPTVWLHAIIVVCSYVGYKATDDFSLLAHDALGFDDVASSSVGALGFWIRAVAAIGAGYLGDRFKSSRVITWGFGVLIVGSLLLASGMTINIAWMLIMTIAASSAGIYALRGVYFALLEEGQVPLARSGSAIGVISFIGFTPDVFMGPLMGVLLDNSPGVLGHQHLFGVVALFGLIGLVATIAFRKIS